MARITIAIVALVVGLFLGRQRQYPPPSESSNLLQRSWLDKYGSGLFGAGGLLIAIITVSGQILNTCQTNDTSFKTKQLEGDNQQGIVRMQLEAESTRHRITTQKDIELKQFELLFVDKQKRYSSVMNNMLNFCLIAAGRDIDINPVSSVSEELFNMAQEIKADLIALWVYMSRDERDYIHSASDRFFAVCTEMARFTASTPGQRVLPSSPAYIDFIILYEEIREGLASILFRSPSIQDR
jgi:hypothetical protein